MDDNALMARLAQEDSAALEELIRRHRGPALRYAQSLLKDASSAEDAVQEAFARVYLLRHAYRPDFAFSTYLRAILRNLCIDQLRRQRVLPLPDPTEGVFPSAEDVFLRQESRLALWNQLRSLDPRDRELLTGYALEGRSYRELARRTGLTLAQVKIRLHRIRRRLHSKERDPS